MPPPHPPHPPKTKKNTTVARGNAAWQGASYSFICSLATTTILLSLKNKVGKAFPRWVQAGGWVRLCLGQFRTNRLKVQVELPVPPTLRIGSSNTFLKPAGCVIFSFMLKLQGGNREI